MTILITIVFSAILAFVLGVALGFFQKAFAVERDPKIDEVRAVLPGANCGACGFAGCDGYAEAVALGKTATTNCKAGGSFTAAAVSKVMGVKASSEDLVAVLQCQGGKDLAADRGAYVGLKNCRAAKIAVGGVKKCARGCQGFGDCVDVCKFNALSMGPDGLPHVDYNACTGCGLCAQECPQQLFAMVPRSRKGSIVLCSNRNVIKQAVGKACKTGCIKCDICVKACPEHCIKMVDGIPVTDYAACTSCGICVEKCPTHAYKLLEKDVQGTRKLVAQKVEA